jgi:acyl-CoA thioester hydrolase
VLELRDKSIRFVHEMRNAEANEVAALCELTGVHMDRTARRAVPFPPDVSERIAAAII